MPARGPSTAPSGYYVVRPGDTLYRISVYLGVPMPALLAANPHVDSRFLRPGMTIRLPGRRIADPPPRPLPQPPAQMIALTGIITEEGATCPATRGSDGRLYTLAGDIRRVRAGDRIRVEGRIASASVCMQGTTIEVHRIRSFADGDIDDGPHRLVTVTGTVTNEGVECTAIRGNDGRLYTLAGNAGAIRPGDRVHVAGRRAEVSFCRQGITLEVERIRRLG